MCLVLGDVIDGAVLRMVVVPHRSLGTYWWQSLEVVMRRGRGGEPLECTAIPRVLAGLHDVLAPYRHADVDEHEDEGEPDQPAADARGDVETLPTEIRGVGRHPARHAF